MQKITLPQKITFTQLEDENDGQIVVEPCYPGYGTTLGNGLRRVLLSSLKGAAVTGIKIKDASHEFTAIPQVKEDVLEIILNLKNLRLKFFGEEGEVVKLELKAQGEKKVRAADISKNSQVEIMNPELHIAEITDDSGSLEMEIFVTSGYGYSPIEGRKTPDKEVGYIELDSIFSPVKAVKVNVENARVGQMTDWDRLIIEIKTDGTVSFREAFMQAAEILVEQFSFVLDEVKKEIGEEKSEETSGEEGTEEVKEKKRKESKK
jgi:DNA-directed RNA polymerase subunit alpha